jgi:hypothetical protein
MPTITDDKMVNPSQLVEEITTALPVLIAGDTALVSVAAEYGVPGVMVWLDDGQAALVPNVEALIDAHAPVAPAPPLIQFVRSITVDARVRTTNDVALVVFTFPTEAKHRYEAALTISGIDAGNFASKVMEGRFVWKRATTAAAVTGITVVSDIHDSAAAAWAPNCLPSGTDVVFTVKGAVGRTIDWLLVGQIQAWAPEGLS